MRLDWYVEKWEKGVYIDRCPLAMSKDEAHMLAKQARTFPNNKSYTFKPVHRLHTHESKGNQK